MTPRTWKPDPDPAWSMAWRTDANGRKGFLCGHTQLSRRECWNEWLRAHEVDGVPADPLERRRRIRKLYRKGCRVIKVLIVPQEGIA